MSSTFGRVFTLTTYGESHGPGIGGVVDGCPAGLPLDEALIQRELDRRRPGARPETGNMGSARRESDTVHLLSGVFGGITTGTPIAFSIANEDKRSADYGPLADLWRPGHADMTYDAKYGVRDYRGGGRSSGRETAARVAGGAIAQALLALHGIRIRAFATEVGGLAAEWTESELDDAETRPYSAASASVIPSWDELAAVTRARGDTLGGVVTVEALGVPAGLGEPVFHKLDAVLAQALMSVGAVKGVEVGEGFGAARLLGSQNNDRMRPASADNGFKPQWESNHAGGILGGISTGAPIVLRAAVKPIPSVALPQRMVTRRGESLDMSIGGRHDICAIPRVVPVLKAMTALVLADMLLWQCRMDAVNLHAWEGRRPSCEGH
ncbi:MAG: chorismate synthase [Desulfovibrionaceae bacterium]|nr:chorismate synthase [Desulfovibrionaceae bacterium]